MNDTINRYLAILCYPFASLDFFYEDLFEKMNDNYAEVNQELKRRIIYYMQLNYSIYSYDEIYLYLEKCYLYNIRMKKDGEILELYYDCMKKIVRSMLSQRDGKIVFKYWENEMEEEFLGGFGIRNKVFLFHSLTMHIPMDFIIMFYIIQNDENEIDCLDNFYGQIEIADQQLEKILEKGVAENHLHKGVSLHFSEIWENLMLPVGGGNEKDFERIKLGMQSEKREEGKIYFFILTASVVRVWLALLVKSKLWNIKEDKYKEYFQSDKELYDLILSFMEGRKLEELYYRKWRDCKETEIKYNINAYFIKIWETVLSILPPQKENLTMIQQIFSVPITVNTLDENIFLFYMMRFWKGQKSRQISEEDSRILKCFMQYLRIKNYFFKCTVQDKTIRGLDYFQEKFYRGDSALNAVAGAISKDRSGKDIQVLYWELAMRKQFQNSSLRKVEFRASISDNELLFRKNVHAFLCAYRNILREDYCIKRKDGKYQVCRSFPRVGLVYHLLKRKDSAVPEKCFLDGKDNREREQFGILEDKYEELITIMCNLRDKVCGLERYIVGLDAASLENATPVWVFADIYEKARDSKCEKINYNMSVEQSLRFTFHAGEDFRHILSGLRRVDEVITFLKFHAGDRIGHGTVLGVSVEKWKLYNPIVVIPRIEALENYIWAYYVLSQDTTSFQSTLMAYLESKAYKLACEIYGISQNFSMQTLIEGYLMLFRMDKKEIHEQCEKAKNTGFCNEVQGGKCDEICWNGKKIALARHCKKFLKEMEKPINLEVTEQDAKIAEILQNLVKNKLSKSGIIVEVNPSSNMAIGEVDKIADNQIYNLNQPSRLDNVMVCVNSDDPTVFNTNVSNELAYIYYGMLYNSVSRENALEWIDKIRNIGMEASFIQIRENDQQAYDMLEKIIRYL